MVSFKRLALVVLLLTVAISSIRCTIEEKSVEKAHVDDIEEEEFDYELQEGDFEQPLKQELSPIQNNYIQAQPYPAQNYSKPAPIPTYAAAPNYSAPNLAPNYPVPAPAAPTYQAPAPVPAPTYSQPASTPTYIAPAPASNYSAPAPAPTYSAPPPAPTYSAPPPAPTYSAPPPAPAYSTPPPAPAPSYTPPAPSSTYAPPPVLNNTYRPPPPPPPPVALLPPPPVGNYSKPNYVAPVAPYPLRPVGGNYTQPLPLRPQLPRYSFAELAPFIPAAGYRANHWSLHYYKATPYKLCPKNIYMSSPSYKDIEAAFASAQQFLAINRNSNIQYMNTSQPSWAARHAVFSFMSQLSARMDEEGLLVELVSQYLADRACLTKWDKQRYLPQLTKFIGVNNYPGSHSCWNYYNVKQASGYASRQCALSKYRTFDGFCNNPYNLYWGKSNVCHIRLLSPDYADGISAPRVSYARVPLPNPRVVSSYIHNDIPLESPYNLMKMQWGQFINHDITNTALSSYEGLVDCCKNPNIRGCLPMYVPPDDYFYSRLNVTCLNFIRSGVCPLCQLGPRQQINKNTAFLDASHIYGNTLEQAIQLRVFKGGLLKSSGGKNGEALLPLSQSQEQCSGICYQAGDARVNQHPALTALHTLLHRNHNHHARALALRHPNYTDEMIFQEARRIVIAEYQMITYSEYLPIVFGPILSAYYKLIPQARGHTYWEPKADPTTWNEYATASCRFGHSQIQSTFGMYAKIYSSYGQQIDPKLPSFRLKEWFMRPSFLNDGLLTPIINGLLSRPALAVDPWITTDVRNHLYQSHKELSGGDLPATNILRGRDHGIPGYIHYVEYCFNYKVRTWKDLAPFIPYHTLGQLRKLYRVVENIDLFTGGLAERHFPGADIGPTFACINGIQYYHLKFGDRYYFEHGNQPGSFNLAQLEEIKRSTLARLLCRTAYLQAVPQYAFMQPSIYNPLVDCRQLGEIDYSKF